MQKDLAGSRVFLCSLSLAVALALCAPAGATTYNWNANTTGNWSTAANWTPSGPPNNGDDVFITNVNASVILSSASSNLSSLTLGGTNAGTRTLTCTNWDTALTATNVTVLTNGVIALPAAFTNNGVSNNIYVVCSNFTIAAGGSIYADFGGYAGLSQSTGGGPGGGYVSMGGAGYGGKGGSSTLGLGGGTYGSPNAPTAPGSAGGAHTSAGYPGGSGGGAVRIQASGTVAINGTITANGAITGPNSSSGAGSGGSIYITCSSLSGSGGVVRACGGDGPNADGGGGRIAVVYGTNEQAMVAVPSIIFRTTPGRGSNARRDSDVGTLYFPDTRFLTETFQHIGQWLGATNWAANNLLVSNGWARFPANGFQLTVTNSLNVVGTNIYTHKLELNTNGVVNCGGDVMVNNAALTLIVGATGGTPFNCSGNLILTNGCAMSVYSGPTNNGSPTAWGALISVTNDIRIATNSFLYLHSDPTNGGAPLLRMQNLTIAAGGTISADSRGFMGLSQAQGYGPGGGSGYQGGGGYGGQGGQSGSSTRGVTYGNSNAPILPGSAGGAHTSAGYPGGSGGGEVRVEAAGTITLNGTITANGAATGPNSSSGGGSGGGIYLRCRTFAGNGGVVRVIGGNGPFADGGGGRIAIWRIYNSFSGTALATAGTNLADSAGDGTIVWGQIPPPGTIITFR